MGLGETDPASEKGVGGKGLLASPAPVHCSICLEVVKDGGDRSTAKLQCGHQFHLDCIGSAFNAKGMMQCPNCRKIEKGNWLYANGCRSFPDISLDDWTHDEDLYELNYSEMPYGVHWCPFNRLPHVPSSFEEGESTSIPYHDLVGRHAVFAEHPVAPSSAHSCPYVAYYHPLRPSPSSSQPSTDSLTDGPTFHHHWSSLSGSSDIHTSHPFPAIDFHYHNWEPHSPPYSTPNSRISGTDQASASATMRASMLDLDGHLRPGSFLHPFVIGHGSPSGAGTSAVSAGPPYIGNSRGQGRMQELHGTYQHHNTPGTQPSIRRSGGMRNLVPTTPTVPEHTRFYLFPPVTTSGRSPQEGEAAGGNRFYAWERDQLAPFPLMPVERDSAWWGPFPPASSSSDSGSRAGMWHRHGSERSSSDGSSHRLIQPPRMYPFI